MEQLIQINADKVASIKCIYLHNLLHKDKTRLPVQERIQVENRKCKAQQLRLTWERFCRLLHHRDHKLMIHTETWL